MKHRVEQLNQNCIIVTYDGDLNIKETERISQAVVDILKKFPTHFDVILDTRQLKIDNYTHVVKASKILAKYMKKFKYSYIIGSDQTTIKYFRVLLKTLGADEDGILQMATDDEALNHIENRKRRRPPGQEIQMKF
ncbi:MAG: hypothetical protein KDD94_10720 [Calditrichaeota bacterium]|nr:hypothetical protein [Calditrichota bacterium]